MFPRRMSSCCPITASECLLPGRAMSLCPPRAALLRVRRGRVWVTMDGPQPAARPHERDRVLAQGDVLRVPARVRLVMEPLALAGDAQPAYVDWIVGVETPFAQRLTCEVLAPARECGQALQRAAQSLMQSMRGLVLLLNPLGSGRC